MKAACLHFFKHFITLLLSSVWRVTSLWVLRPPLISLTFFPATSPFSSFHKQISSLLHAASWGCSPEGTDPPLGLHHCALNPSPSLQLPLAPFAAVHLVSLGGEWLFVFISRSSTLSGRQSAPNIFKEIVLNESPVFR